MNELIEQLTPAIVSLAATILTFLAYRANAYLKAKTGFEIEAMNRDALHSALETGVELAIAKASKNKTAAAAAQDELVDLIVAYVKRSVPDAIGALKPSQEQLKDMAIAKVEQRIPAEVRDLAEKVGLDLSAIAKAGW